MKRAKRRRRSAAERQRAREFLATPQGQAWLARKIAEKNAARPDPGPAPERLTRTRLPFGATVNGEPVLVSRDADGAVVVVRA